MQAAVHGTILAAFPFEESYIIDLFSKEYGRIKFVAKTTKAKMLGYGPLLEIEASVVPSEKEFWKCRDCVICTSHPQLRSKLLHLQQAARLCKLLTKIIPLHAPLPDVYLLFDELLKELPSFLSAHVGTLAFLAKFCRHEGWLPHELLLPRENEICLAISDLPYAQLYTENLELSLLEKLTERVL